MKKKYKLGTVALHITYQCSHFCPMCYAGGDDSSKKRQGYPKIEQVKGVLDNLSQNGIENISFVGGDPAKYPYILEASKYANFLGCDLSILSNTLDFEKNAIEIAKYINAFEGTIHDTTEELHDAFCNKKGAYSLLTKNLRLFSDMGKRIGIAINITPFTYDKIFIMIENILQKNIKVNYVVLQRIIPFGRATKSHEYELNLHQIDVALQNVEKIENMGIDIVFEDPFPMCSVKEQYRHYMHPCEWGLTKVSVDYEGNLSRCGADPRCTLGNIFSKPLLEIWENTDELYEFREKTYLPEKCQSCKMLDDCGGACPISQTSKDFYSEDYISLLRGEK